MTGKDDSIISSGGYGQADKAVRSLLYGMGYRFRLHRKDLPGKPDIVLRKYNAVIFVHGCFWHRHKGCKDSTIPSTNTEFWKKKFSDNVARDKKNQKLLRDLGWRIAVIWECELKRPEKVKTKIKKFLHK